MIKEKVIIDTDPGIDDAVALAAALFSDRLDVKLITTVAGNVSVDKVTANALKLLTFWGKKIPVAKGAAKPLIDEFVDAETAITRSRTRTSARIDPAEPTRIIASTPKKLKSSYA